MAQKGSHPTDNSLKQPMAFPSSVWNGFKLLLYFLTVRNPTPSRPGFHQAEGSTSHNSNLTYCQKSHKSLAISVIRGEVFTYPASQDQ